MELSIFQILIVSLLSMFSSVIGAGGTTYAWYTCSRPLVASMLVGLVFGDVTTAILLGAAVQVVYIALVTPGGTVSADLAAVSYIGIPLAIAAVKGAGLDPAGAEAQGLAVSICAAVGTVGTVLFYSTAVFNLVWQEIGWKAFDKRDYKTVFVVTYFLPMISHFLIRFIPTFLILQYGLPYVANIKDTFPMDSLIMKTLFTVGSLLPAVGIAILLKMVVKNALDLVIFAFGFTLAKVMGVNLVGAALVGGFFALLNFRYGFKGAVAKEEEL
jgi:mannose PTS system EIIC component